MCDFEGCDPFDGLVPAFITALVDVHGESEPVPSPSSKNATTTASTHTHGAGREDAAASPPGLVSVDEAASAFAEPSCAVADVAVAADPPTSLAARAGVSVEYGAEGAAVSTLPGGETSTLAAPPPVAVAGRVTTAVAPATPDGVDVGAGKAIRAAAQPPAEAAASAAPPPSRRLPTPKHARSTGRKGRDCVPATAVSVFGAGAGGAHDTASPRAPADPTTLPLPGLPTTAASSPRARPDRPAPDSATAAPPSSTKAAHDAMLCKVVGALNSPAGSSEPATCLSSVERWSGLHDDPLVHFLRARVACAAGRLNDAAAAIGVATSHDLDAAAACVSASPPSAAEASRPVSAAAELLGVRSAELQHIAVRLNAELGRHRSSVDAESANEILAVIAAADGAGHAPFAAQCSSLREMLASTWVAPPQPAAAARPLPVEPAKPATAAPLPPAKPATAAPLPPAGSAAVSSHGCFLEELAAADEARKLNMLGERLCPAIASMQPARAGKTTSMLLEAMHEGELPHLLESDASLRERVAEAMDVLQTADAATAAAAAALSSFDSEISTLASGRRSWLFLSPSPLAYPLVDTLKRAVSPRGGVAFAGIAAAGPFPAWPGAAPIRLLCVIGPATVDTCCGGGVAAPECWRGDVPSGRSVVLCLTGACSARISPHAAEARQSRNESARPTVVIALDGLSASCRGCAIQGARDAAVTAVSIGAIEAFFIAE